MEKKLCLWYYPQAGLMTGKIFVFSAKLMGGLHNPAFFAGLSRKIKKNDINGLMRPWGERRYHMQYKNEKLKIHLFSLQEAHHGSQLQFCLFGDVSL